MKQQTLTKRIAMTLLLGLLTLGMQAQDIIIETPHSRTVGNAERTMIYDITAKGAGTLSASVSTEAAGWLSAEFDGTRLRVHVKTNSTASTRYGVVSITGSETGSPTQAFSIAQTGDEYSGAALSSLEDTKYTISSGSSASNASESPFSNSYDGNYSTFWHSAYSSGRALANGNTVTATWDLGSSKSVDFINYVPRSDGSSNGNWGSFTLQYATTSNNWTTIGTYDFGMSSDASSVDFSAVNARYIRVVISSGYNEHASCAEMIIGKRNTSASTVAESLFDDDLWTTLKSSVTQTTINNISNSFIKTLAQAIYDGGYSTTYRVHTAKCFKSPETISNEWKAPGKYYDRLGNVTGISVKKNSKIAIWIPSIPSGANIGLKIVSWFPGKYPGDTSGTYLNDGTFGPIINSYSLHEGMNIIEYTPATPSGATASEISDGLAYIPYFGDTDNQYADVPMHFLNGIENGYLSLDLTNDEMHALCQNAPNMHMDVVTDHAHLVWEANALYNYCRTTTRSGWLSSTGTAKGYRQYIRAIEYIIGSEHEALGLQKYNHVPKTRTLAYVNYQYFMFQGSLGVSFAYDVQEECLDLYQMLKASGASVWGISHEWGHQHQMRPYFNWAGCDEATNNYNSYWNTVRFGLTDTGHGCHPAFGTELYNGTVTSNLTANDKTVYTNITNTRQNAYDNKSTVSWNSYFTTLVENTYNNHLDWTAETTQSVYSFDFTNYCTARPFIAISFYAMNTLNKPDFSYDLFEALRQTDNMSGTTLTGSTVEKSGVDKYELLAAAQNGNTNAYNQFRSAYSSSVWTTKNYLYTGHLSWDVNSVPFILNYIRKASRLSGYNLFPYFEKCGLLRQVAYRTYGGAWYLMTADMYTEFQNDMNSLGLSTCDDNRVKAILQAANPSWTLPSSINND